MLKLMKRWIDRYGKVTKKYSQVKKQVRKQYMYELTFVKKYVTERDSIKHYVHSDKHSPFYEAISKTIYKNQK